MNISLSLMNVLDIWNEWNHHILLNLFNKKLQFFCRFFCISDGNVGTNKWNLILTHFYSIEPHLILNSVQWMFLIFGMNDTTHFVNKLQKNQILQIFPNSRIGNVRSNCCNWLIDATSFDFAHNPRILFENFHIW